MLPNLSGDIILDSGSQTLYTKTLISPIISAPSFDDLTRTHRYDIKPGELAANRNVNLPALTDSDTFIFAKFTQTLLNKTLTTPVISSPKISGAINDVNNSNLLTLTATGSAINYLNLANAAIGNGPTITALGTDSDVTINITAKNGGNIRVSKLATRMTTVTADGGVPRNFSHIDCNKASQLNLTLGNGVIPGEQKIFTNRGAGNAVVTVTNFAHGTSFTLAQNEACSLIWDGNDWFVYGNINVLTIA
jgi:hypothetical protein